MKESASTYNPEKKKDEAHDMIRITVHRFFFIPFAFFIMAFLFSAENSSDIHPFVSDAGYCKKCHENRNFDSPGKACAQYCQTCHKNIGHTHHPIDVRLKKEAEFELTDSRRITCRSCHDPEQKRYDMKSWRAESLYERIFDKKDRYRTYFLKTQNTNGELCKKCH